MDNLLTLKEVADLLRLSPQTIYKMIREGTLAAVQIGNQWRFERDKIQAWLESRSSVKKSAPEIGG